MAHGEHLKVLHGGNEPSVGTQKWSQRVRRDAKGLAGKLDEGYMELARLLYVIYDTPIDGDPKNPPIFRQWGHDSFGDYVEGELGIHRKRAQRLRTVWYNLEIRLKDQIDPEVKKRLVRLGFSKVRELIRVISPRNVEKWVEKGETLSYPKLCKTIQTYQSDLETRREDRQHLQAVEGDGDGGDPVPAESGGVPLDDEEPEVPPHEDDDMFRENFMLYRDQKDMVKQALERAGQLSGSDVKSNNLHLICMDFLATNDFVKATREQKLRYIASMEKTLGFKLVVFDEGDVVYGLQTLEQAAKAD